MKKLNLKFAQDFLSRSEMKQITGGSGSGSGCWCSCPGCWSGHYCLPSGCACTKNSDCIMGICNSSGWSPYGTCA